MSGNGKSRQVSRLLRLARNGRNFRDLIGRQTTGRGVDRAPIQRQREAGDSPVSASHGAQ